MAQEHIIWRGINVAGRVLVTAYAGYGLARFEPDPKLKWEKHIRLPLKLVGYGLIGYAAYDAIRVALLKAK